VAAESMADEILRTEDVDQDGVSYTVNVHHSYTGYWATWTCRSCSESGVLSFAASIDDAVAKVEAALISDHHLRVHRISRPTRPR
jgi:hypothetical protein